MPADPDDDALWRRVTETVTPLKERRSKSSSVQEKGLGEGEGKREADRLARPSFPKPSPSVRGGSPPSPLKVRGNTLDASWDKRLITGLAAPDVTIDLHGFTVARAHGELEAGLARAIARGARVVLLVTGRPPPPGRSRLDDPLRGIIRASVNDWLEHSPHAGRIAAIRPAHPRHGGAGALYLVLRRAR